MVESTQLFRRWLRHKRIGLDTSFLIPILGEDKVEETSIVRLVRLIEKKSIVLVTSTITLLELLVHPYRSKNLSLVRDYYGYLTRLPLLKLLTLTPEISDRAAELRAVYGFKTPDAVQLATALAGGATLFLTRDHRFRKQKEIELGIL